MYSSYMDAHSNIASVNCLEETKGIACTDKATVIMCSILLQVDGAAGPYDWFSYEETEALVVDIASAMTEVGVSEHEKCSIYGSNCAQWMIAMQASIAPAKSNPIAPLMADPQ